MKEYTFVGEYSYKDFEKECNRLLGEGWTPQGGISVSFDSDGSGFYAQAFVR